MGALIIALACVTLAVAGLLVWMAIGVKRAMDRNDNTPPR